MTCRVRSAVLADAAAITAIYNQGIAARTATFETRLRTVEETASLVERTRPPHAVLVALGKPSNEVAEHGQVLGWASTTPYSPRPVYAGIAEFSIYIDHATHGRGLGRLLLTALVRHAELAGLHKLTSRVFPENTASRALCAALGFREAGTLQRHAQLDGHWRDVIVVERLLGAALTDPCSQSW